MLLMMMINRFYTAERGFAPLIILYNEAVLSRFNALYHISLASVGCTL